MPYEITGPHLTAALLCERVLMEADGATGSVVHCIQIRSVQREKFGQASDHHASRRRVASDRIPCQL